MQESTTILEIPRSIRPVDRRSSISAAVLVIALLGSVVWWTAGPSYSSPGWQFGSPAIGPLPDGQTFGLLRSISADRLVVDPAMVLSGRLAVEAAIEDGVIPPTAGLTDEVYVRNVADETIAVDMAPDVKITVLAYDANGEISPVDITAEQLTVSLDGGYGGVPIHGLRGGRAFPIVLHIDNGVVVRLVQPYLP